jgi:hypothetical protein
MNLQKKIKIRQLFYRDNWTTSPWGWPKLQITLCDTKSSWRIPMVNYNYESIPEPVFRLPS